MMQELVDWLVTFLVTLTLSEDLRSSFLTVFSALR